jgi:outer membrane protein OmpA-like peptidoglycan-associated protein/opacity protein-like surface antigen
MRHIILFVLACAGMASPAPAQRAGQVELGVFGAYTRFDRAFALENQFGGGGRLGYFFTNVFGIEVDASYQQPQASVGGGGATLLSGSASLVLNFGNERNLFYILGGFSRLDFGAGAPYRFTDNGVHGAIGDRIFLGPSVALRGEVRATYAPQTGFAGGDWVGHVVGSLGFSLFAFGRPPADTDHDTIADKRDACPTTPAGATVDARGCPSDSDHDGSYNGLDACPNTPAGAQTDPTGCPLDTDKDVVPDGIDQCPATAAGAFVDARGCPTDADADRVPDGLDKCPNTVAGASVDAAGCHTDADRDGVADGLDRCPGTPAGTEVDASGCQRARDTDGDGVDDARDGCARTAAGTRVDASGCPILFTPERASVVLRGVTFATGRSTLLADSYVVLDLVAESLVGNPDIVIEVGGHTDITGSAATNQRLSQARADAVRAYLASKGVRPDRMTARGYGPAQPVAPNNTPAGRAQNRRVELRRMN